MKTCPLMWKVPYAHEWKNFYRSQVHFLQFPKGQNVLFLKRSEYKTKRPVTKIYLERQKSEEGVGSPAEQGDAESWVVFSAETRAACRGTKNHPARGISLRSRAAHYPSHFFVSKNKFESPIVAFFVIRSLQNKTFLTCTFKFFFC